MNPTNQELALALRNLSAQLAVGPAIILRLAADRLREDWSDVQEPTVEVQPMPEFFGEISDELPVSAEEPENDGWIEWDASAPDAEDGPQELDRDTPIDVVLRDGKEFINDGDTVCAYIWSEIGKRTVAKFRVSRA